MARERVRGIGSTSGRRTRRVATSASKGNGTVPARQSGTPGCTLARHRRGHATDSGVPRGTGRYLAGALRPREGSGRLVCALCLYGVVTHGVGYRWDRHADQHQRDDHDLYARSASGSLPPPLDPANGSTSVRFELPRAGLADLDVFDIAGRYVALARRGRAGLRIARGAR